MEDDGGDVPRGDHRKGGGAATATNAQHGDNCNCNGRGGGVGYPFRSSDGDKGDQFCPILELPSAATTAQDLFDGSRRGDGGGGRREAGGGGGGGRRSSAEGWPNGMSDMVRFWSFWLHCPTHLSQFSSPCERCAKPSSCMHDIP